MALIQMLVWGKNVEDRNCPSPGLLAAAYLEIPELLLISNVKTIETYFAFERRTGTKCQDRVKLTMHHTQKKKIRHKNKIKKKNMVLKDRNLNLSNDTKTYVQISWGYPFKFLVYSFHIPVP
jgi:hypothetical protein